ncbi:hypothetical protein M3616_11200 [Bacillus velezensis]|uniref:hypothetical protein n=1 Tax=Bacillus amyloliquefaciens group TaxID=1938374 RepID=UPI00093F4F21|nr:MULTISPECIES: hypothetical protein [Bacillus amyloliquefaciens group]MCA1231429.1 hypothetical protein [Bacillus velezensis]MCA1309529.1 hypothetical protein [Bacillus velezensis]MCA1329178.1 hypothetical protein [Bacillus velezensis]MCM3276664.1 hypothetical protein [Bacillus velezensis]MCM3349788.1 hypothetical protein [Bacillus velezensis]
MKNLVMRDTHCKEAALNKIKQILDAGQILEVKSTKEEPSLKNQYNKYSDICYSVIGYDPY